MRKLFLPSALVFLLVSSLAAAVPAAEEEVEEARCHGRRATIVGTAGDDLLQGTPERDVIWGGDGDDTILGSLGNDLLCGGPRSDPIHAGRGHRKPAGGGGHEE